MNTQTDETPGGKTRGARWPWWEPYVFTAFFLAAVVALLMVFGYIARIPFVEHILFALMTVAAVIEASRRSSTVPSLAGNISLTLFFSVACFAYVSKAELLLGIGYAVLAVIWFCLSINAAVARRRMKRERSAKLDRAVETLRRAVENDK